TTSFNVLKDDYQLIEGPIHLENFVRVDHCTRQDQLINEIEQIAVDPNRLILDLYHKALSKGETYMIKVKGLPEGYSIGDLIYYSSDPNIATVDDKGTIKAVSTGATEINVKTKDEKYLISMTVLVKSE
ncbi:MAG: Ig-like domain-containing protein, partial [Erysipelotrichaceae bacterium]|nr:Ig-like domain-containing protein [Erysipelotrichaceae bacterium]